MKYRTLGDGLTVSALGIGCMPMVRGGNITYGETASEDESIATIHRAIDLGITFFDTAEMYGPFTNESLVGEAIKGKRDGLVIATKFALLWDGDQPVGIDGSPANARRACEGSLKRLGIDTIDLFYQHRVDPLTPIEETIGGIADLVAEGKVRHIGLSEAAPETIRRAAAVHPIAALQSEYSLWEREVEGDVLPVCRELGIGFVPYSPLGRGFLTGQIRSRADLPADDWRHNDPALFGGEFRRQPEDRRRDPRGRRAPRRQPRPDRHRLAARPGRRHRPDSRRQAPRSRSRTASPRSRSTSAPRTSPRLPRPAPPRARATASAGCGWSGSDEQ